MSDDIYDVVIVGGGAAGISALHTLETTNNLLLESSASLGGRVESIAIDSAASAELGAFYPLNPVDIEPDIPQQSNSRLPRFLFIQSPNNFSSFPSFYDAFHSLSNNDALDKSHLFYQKYLVDNLLINLRIPNARYGDLSLLSTQQLQLVEALHQITHPGNISIFPPNLRPLCLESPPSFSRTLSNNSALLNQFPVPINSKIGLNSTVTSIQQVDDFVETTYVNNSRSYLVKSRSLILTPPPSSCFHTLKYVREESLRFYQSSPYLGGWSFVLFYQGSEPSHTLLVSTNHAWSVCFISLIDHNHFIVNCYIPFARTDQSLENNHIEYISNSLASYLPTDSVLKHSYKKYWRYLAPQISNSTLNNYVPDHSRLSSRIFYAGELSTFSPRHMYSYGLSNAINAGNIAANSVLKFLKDSTSSFSEITYPPLLTAFIYHLLDERPRYIGSQKEGNIAFYGLLLLATRDRNIYNYLLSHSINGLWEYHTGFGVTLEDSLLVLEGLIDNGLDESTYKYHLDKCIHEFYDHNTSLFSTITKGRANYWEGSSVHGTVHAYYLIFKYYQELPPLVSVSQLVDYLYTELSDNHLWNSRWFVNSHFTSFYVVRLLCILPLNPKVTSLITIFAEKLIQTQLNNGSWDNSFLSTSCCLSALTLMIKNNIIPSNKQTVDVITLSVKFLRSSNQDSFANEPILYYWYEHLSSKKDSSKRFYHCVDNGLIVKSLIDLSLRSLNDITL